MPNKPKLVLLHGWAMSSDIFQPWLSYLNPYVEIANLDLPGHGNRHWSDLNTDQHTDPLAGLFTQINTFFGTEGGLILGWSLGGLVAQAYYVLYPDRVKALILIGSAPKFNFKTEQLKKLELELQKNFTQTLFDFLSLQTIGMDEAHSKDFLQLYKHIPQPDLKALNWGLNYLETADFRARYPLNCPNLIILGEKDRLVSPKMAPELIKLGVNTKVHLLKKSAHLPFWTEPDICLNLLLELL
jgi:pimeloyl-[acyl-carrier protein] methyl ester esterase